MSVNTKMAASFSEYVQTWNDAYKLRERLEGYSAGRLRLLPREGLIVLEIEKMPVACCATGKDAAYDVVVCFGRWATKDVDC